MSGIVGTFYVFIHFITILLISLSYDTMYCEKKHLKLRFIE